MAEKIKKGFCKWCGMQFVTIIVMIVLYIFAQVKLNQLETKVDNIQTNLIEELEKYGK